MPDSNFIILPTTGHPFPAQKRLFLSLLVADKVYKSENNVYVIAGTFNQTTIAGVNETIAAAGLPLPNIAMYIKGQATHPENIEISLFLRVMSINDVPDTSCVEFGKVTSDLTDANQCSFDIGFTVPIRLIANQPGRKIYSDRPNTMYINVEAWVGSDLLAFARIRVTTSPPQGLGTLPDDIRSSSAVPESTQK